MNLIQWKKMYYKKIMQDIMHVLILFVLYNYYHKKNIMQLEADHAFL
jgi:hypothetical protein